jgi:hypothetical protein
MYVLKNLKSTFFKKFNEIKTAIIPEDETFIDDGNTKTDNPTFGEFNMRITRDEVRAEVRNLHRNKSASPSDNLLNEYFIETIDIMVRHIIDLFDFFTQAIFQNCGRKVLLYLRIKRG